MLNELLEYKQYTFEPEHYDSDHIYLRLKPQKMQKKQRREKNIITGIRRPLHIIARKILFDRPEPISEKKITVIRDALSAWCGYKESREYPFLNNWFPRYLICCWYTPALNKLINGKSKPDKDLLDLLNIIRTEMKCDQNRLKEITKKMDAFIESVNAIQNPKELTSQCTTLSSCISIITALKASEKEYTTNTKYNLRQKKKSHNTENLIRFDGIIAGALNAGPLKQFALTSCCSETDILQHIQRNVHGDLRILGMITQSKINGWDIILKLTAAYLLHKAPGQTIVCFTKQDVTAWLMSDSNLDKKNYAERFFYTQDGKKSSYIFNPVTINGSTIFFMEMNQDFLHDYGWQVIEIPAGSTWKEVVSEQDIKTCYIDQGSGKSLEMHSVQ